MGNFFRAILVVLVLAILVRSFPIFIGSMTCPDPWFHARMSEMVIEQQSVPTFDPFSMQGRYYSYAPLFHVFIASFSMLSGIAVLPITPILPVFYGAMAVFLVFAFARRFFGSRGLALFAALSVTIMPLHLMRTAAYARPDSLAMLLVPAIIFLIYIRKFLPAALLTVGLVLLHPLSSLYLFGFLVFWMAFAKFRRIDFEFKKTFFIILLGVLVWLVWLYSLPYSPGEYVSGVSLESAENSLPLLVNFFTFFTFTWIFILLAFWKLDLKKHIFLIFWFFFSLFIGLFSTRLMLFLAVPAAIIGANGFGLVFEKTRKFFPVLLAILFVLSAIVVVEEINGTRRFVNFPERRAMAWLQNTPVDSVIASQWDRGHPLAYLAKRPIMIDGYFEFVPDLEERNASMKILISSSDCNKLSAEAKKWGADFFFVHHDAIYSETYRNGLLEADCNFISKVYASDYSIILGFR